MTRVVIVKILVLDAAEAAAIETEAKTHAGTRGLFGR